MGKEARLASLQPPKSPGLGGARWPDKGHQPGCPHRPCSGVRDVPRPAAPSCPVCLPLLPFLMLLFSSSHPLYQPVLLLFPYLQGFLKSWGSALK